MLPKLAEIFDITSDELLGIPRKEPLAADDPPDPPSIQQNALGAEAEKTNKLSALASPGVAFGFWLFLTGLVAFVDSFRSSPCELTDIMIACGILSFGLFGLFRRFSLLRVGCTIAGSAFVANLLTVPGITDMDWSVPLAAGIALLGLDLLINAVRNPKGSWKVMPYGHNPSEAVKNDCSYDGTRFRCAVRFGEGDRVIQLPRLSGGQGEVTCGELTVDLSGCPEIDENCRIDLRCTFGALKLLVPRRYRVETAISNTFGEVKEKGPVDPGAEFTIYVNCAVSFGEIEIRHI